MPDFPFRHLQYGVAFPEGAKKVATFDLEASGDMGTHVLEAPHETALNEVWQTLPTDVRDSYWPHWPRNAHAISYRIVTQDLQDIDKASMLAKACNANATFHITLALNRHSAKFGMTRVRLGT